VLQNYFVSVYNIEFAYIITAATSHNSVSCMKRGAQQLVSLDLKTLFDQGFGQKAM
jgi:hypothetical protein